MTIDFYMMDASAPCRAVMLTARYLGINFNIKYLNLMKHEQLKPEFVKINPLHKVPTIDDNGLILWESRAIMTYLVNQYAPDSELYPEDPNRRAIVDKFLNFDLGTIWVAIYDAMFGHGFYGKPRNPEKEEILRNTIQTVDELLAKTPFFAGDKLTLADISIISTLGVAKLLADVMEFDFSPYRHLSAWEERVKEQLPYFKEVNELGEKQLSDFIATVKR